MVQRDIFLEDSVKEYLGRLLVLFGGWRSFGSLFLSEIEDAPDPGSDPYVEIHLAGLWHRMPLLVGGWRQCGFYLIRGRVVLCPQYLRDYIAQLNGRNMRGFITLPCRLAIRCHRSIDLIEKLREWDPKWRKNLD